MSDKAIYEAMRSHTATLSAYIEEISQRNLAKIEEEQKQLIHKED